MDLTHQSITNQQFELNRRGYDPDAVDAHLGQIAAAVTERERHVAELEKSVASLQETVDELQAKVQDANESEEALRLTLKAAAHAKEELLAGAREQAEEMQREAHERAQSLLSESEQKARATEAEAQARAEAMTSGASARAQDVARAALAESELLVARIEGLRQQLATAEQAVQSLRTEAEPRLADARNALEHALGEARAAAENPELLAAAAAPVDETPAADQQATPDLVAEEAVADHVGEAGSDSDPAVEDTPASANEPESTPAAPQLEVVQPVAEEEPPPVQATSVDDGPGEQSSPQHEAVSEPAQTQAQDTPEQPEQAPGDSAPPAESTADISDKVDRLLEELREVT